MEFDSQALQDIEVIDFEFVGARVISFTEDRRKSASLTRSAKPTPPEEQASEAIVPRWTLSEEAMPAAITANWSRLAKAKLGRDAFLKIVRIASRPEGWRGAGSRSLRPAALRHFLEFWISVRHASVPPQFALLPNGHLQALWTSSDRRRMDLEYTESKRVYFGVLNRRRSHEGVEALNVIAKLLLAHPSRPLTWTPGAMAKNKQQPKKKVDPEFISSTRLTRYVDEDQREHDDRPAPAHFCPIPVKKSMTRTGISPSIP